MNRASGKEKSDCLAWTIVAAIATHFIRIKPQVKYPTWTHGPSNNSTEPGKKNVEHGEMGEEYFYRKYCKNATALQDKYIAHCTIT